MDQEKLDLLIKGVGYLVNLFGEPLIMAMGALIAFAVAFGIKKLVIE